jgi:serine/threonine protein kinase
MSELRAGLVFGRYEIVRRLGRGGMGTVYQAADPTYGRAVPA